MLVYQRVPHSYSLKKIDIKQKKHDADADHFLSKLVDNDDLLEMMGDLSGPKRG